MRKSRCACVNVQRGIWKSFKFFILAFTTLLPTYIITIKPTSMDSPRHYLSCALWSLCTRSLSVMRVGRSLSARLTDTERGKWLSFSFEALSRLVAEATPLMQETKRMLLTEEERVMFEDESSPYLKVRKT